MSSVGDVLRHLIIHASGLSEDNRAEFRAAVDEHFGPEETPAADPAVAGQGSFGPQDKDAEIAALQARISELQGGLDSELGEPAPPVPE